MKEPPRREIYVNLGEFLEGLSLVAEFLKSYPLVIEFLIILAHNNNTGRPASDKQSDQG